MTTQAPTDRALLVSKIRFAVEPNNPSLISQWLDAPCPGLLSSLDARKRYYLLQYQLLLATLRDEFVPLHWRCSCLDSFYKPLQQLATLASTQADKREVQRLRFEVAMLGRCCLPKNDMH